MSEWHKSGNSIFRNGWIVLIRNWLGDSRKYSFLSSQDSDMAWSKTKHCFSLFAAQHGYVLPQQTKKSEKET
jgi:hypothetical protein